jgi:UDP-glucose 4-epimerase
LSILVTGGNGFIGSHTCVELAEAGYDFIIMDNCSNSDEKNIEVIQKIIGKNFKFYNADMRDFNGVDGIFKENTIDSVIHFAGLKAVGESVEKPLEYYENNVSGTINVLKAMNKNSCKNIIFSSSATVYGLNNKVPFEETMPLSAINPYGQSKIMIEKILTDLCKADLEWSAVILRYFNPIGAHESGLLGENPKGIPNNLIPYINHVALGDLPYLNIFGNDYDTPDGTGVRDYIHVVDLAKGHIKAMDYGFKHKGAEVFNLGSGKGTSVFEIVKAYEKASGKKIKYKIIGRRAGDVGMCYADIRKAEKVLDWHAKYDIEKMCRDSWNFIKKQHGN